MAAIVLLTLLAICSTARAQLSGSYTVGGSSANYASIEAAITALNSSGVSGAVTFLINSGTYTPPTTGYSLDPVATMSSSNTVTFKPANGATVVIDGSMSTPIFNINGADYFTLDGSNTSGGTTRNWKIINRGSGQVIRFINGATYNTVKNLNLIGASTSSTTGIVHFSTTTTAAGGNSYNVLSANTIGDSTGTVRSATGVYAFGTTGTANVANRIENNDIINFGTGTTIAYGIYTLDGNQQVKILGNRITIPVKTGVTGDADGIRFDNDGDNLLDTMAFNRIWDVSTGGATATIRGINIWYQGLSSSLTMHNNMISVIAGNGTIAGIYIDPTVAAPVYLFYNSVYVGGSNTSAATTSRTVWVATNPVVTARNNILVNERTSTGTNTNRVINVSAATNISTSNYNVLFASGASTTIGYVGTNAYGTLAAWQAVGKDSNSYFGNPRFVDPVAGNLHISTTKRTPVEGRGTPLSGITLDFDGATRSTTTPDIGADEGTFLPLLGNDVEALAIVTPGVGATVRNGTSFTPSGIVNNAGTNGQTGVPVRFRIVDIASGATVYEDAQTTGALAAQSTPTTVTFGATGSVTGNTATLANGSYRILFWTDLSTDGDRANDTISGTIVVKGPLSGTYTIDRNGAGGRNFTSFTAALADLNQLGVSAAVTFQVAGGTYDGSVETFPLNVRTITGGSATNTVTFVPATGATPIIDGNNAAQILNIDGADYVTFEGSNTSGGTTRNWKIINRGGGQVIKFVNGATYNVVRNMNLIGASTSGTTGIVNFSTTTTAAGGNSYNVLSANTIGDSTGTVRSATGIYALGTTGTANVANRIENNDIINFGTGTTIAYGIYTLDGNQQVKILGNRITIPVKTGVSGDAEGIRFDNDGDNLLDTFAFNRIWDISTSGTAATQRGINVWYQGTGSSLTMHNNMISVVAASGTIAGIYIDATVAAPVYLFYNSVYVGGSNTSASTTSRAIWVATNPVVTARNNVLVNERTSTGTGTNRVIDLSSAANTSSFDYNLVWASGTSTAIAYAGTTTYAAFTDWQGAGKETNGANGPVPFINAAGGDLHVDPVRVFRGESRGVTGLGITQDFDRQTRSTTRPDMGADEGNFNGDGIRVVSPNGGESYAVNFQLPVNFTTNRPMDVRIDFSTDGGATWTQKTTVNSTLVGANTAVITTPNMTTNQARVRVVSLGNINEADTSNANFSLVTPVFVVLGPNGGERLVGGDTARLDFTAQFVPPGVTVNVEYSTNNGGTWIPVKTGMLPSPTNPIDWVVPNTPTTQAKVRVYLPNSLSADTSDAAFTIIRQPNVTLTSPTGGERWFIGEKNTISWTSATTDFVNIEYSTDGGSTWTEITHRVPADLGSYEWTVPNRPSTNAMVRVSSYDRPRYFGRSQSFAILRPGITILTPNGGEKYELNEPVVVTWGAQNVTRLRLEYSSNNGATWQTAASGITASTGTYTFTPARIPTTNALIRLVDEDRAGSFDVSDAPFEVMGAKSITIFSPTGGDQYARGSTTSIVWSAPRVARVNVFFSSNAGGSWQQIAAGVDAAQGSLSWNVPNATTNEARIRLVETDVASGTEPVTAETGLFAIVDVVVPSVRVIAPNGGETFTEGDNVNIMWTSSNVQGSVGLGYTTDDGATWTSITTNVPATQGQYAWTVPATPGTAYRVRVVSATASDASDATFTVVRRMAPKLMVLAPNGGESFTVGTEQTVSWTAEDVFGAFTIDYSVDNGTNWVQIGTQPANPTGTGTYSLTWTVPATPSAQVLVRVSSGSLNDASDAVFAIVNKVLEPIKVTSPNGGETWTSREIRSITWQAPADVVNVKVEYSLNGGTDWTEYIASTPNDGTQLWQLPDVPAITSTVLVRISDAADATRLDVSDAQFTITPATSGVSVVTGVAGTLALEGNFPNPFAGATEIRWSQSAGADVSLRIFTADGRVIGTTELGRREAGSQRFTLEAGSLTSGVYHYELVVGQQAVRGTMMVVR